MRVCPECGAKIEDVRTYCPKCGFRFPRRPAEDDIAPGVEKRRGVISVNAKDMSDRQMKTSSDTSQKALDRVGVYVIATGVVFFIVGLFVLLYGLDPSSSLLPETMLPRSLVPLCMPLGIVLLWVAVVLFIYAAYRMRRREI